ncbi:MAG: M4 family metallopeptidase [Pseudolabrys sp.]
MCFICQIVPERVLKRLATDRSFSDEQRKNFTDTIKIDTELRRLRIQAAKLTRVAGLMAEAPTVALAPAVTVYDCHHGQTLPGAQILNPATSPDATAKQVFSETKSVEGFYSQVFGRNSIDDAGMTLISSIHYGVRYNNAFWNGSQMTYGDGDGSIFVDFSKGNDVIGHELTHGVTQYSLQLGYTNEAGGLNESLSDCFGSMFRQWDANQNVNQADWLIGKDIMGPSALEKGFTCLRDMGNPAAKHCLAPQPTKYSQVKPGMDPHLSSGPPNLAFYTIAKAVGGNSWDNVGQIWYRSMTGFGPAPNLKMKAFADRTRAVAPELYPNDTTLARAVDAGWKKVGL